MQVADISESKIKRLANLANNCPIDVLYFADSMGSMNSEQVQFIVDAYKRARIGSLGIHTHDNTGQSITNSLQVVKAGVTWVDSTFTETGRGQGNAQKEYITIALNEYRLQKGNVTQLYELIRKYFKLLQSKYGWGLILITIWPVDVEFIDPIFRRC